MASPPEKRKPKLYSVGGRPGSGWANAVSRRNQMLPRDWTLLGDGDLRRISTVIEQHLRGRTMLATLEACLMVRALLTTGRSFDEVYRLTVYEKRMEGLDLELPAGLIGHEGKWSWWLPAGGPETAGAVVDHRMEPVSPNIWLPAAAKVCALLNRCLQNRRNSSGEYPLFETAEDQLRRRVLTILSEDPVGQRKPRRSATTIESVERWLFRALAQEAGGDPAAAALITRRREPIARSSTYYGAMPMRRSIALHKRSLSRVDPHSHARCPAVFAQLAIGDRSTPTDATLRRLTRHLGARLANSGGEIVEAHEAMSWYTVALLAFALGLRGGGNVPGHHGIDPDTGFAFVHDKYRARPERMRLVWVCDVARRQLREYELHLDRLAYEVGIDARKRLLEVRESANGTLPLVRMQNRFRLAHIGPEHLLDAPPGEFWPGKRNAGRHWLRAKLSGRCSAETLGAFFGHWHTGIEPWSTTSGLDPLRYRADLQRALNGLLESVGWEVRPSPLVAGCGW